MNTVMPVVGGAFAAYTAYKAAAYEFAVVFFDDVHL